MLDLGFKLTKTKILAIEKCAQIVYDEIPKTDKNADFIQTDWPMMLIDYLKRTGKYYRD